MRNMTQREIMEFIKTWTWGTLIGVEGGKPYAVEVSYGTDGDFIYCGSMPGGRMARCIRENQNVVFKICDCDWSYAKYRAVIVEAAAERLTDYQDILYSVQMIAGQRRLDEHTFNKIADKVASSPDSNSLRIPIQNVGGKIAGW